MVYVIPPPAQAALPVAGLDSLFPVHRIFCIGRNYAEHAREMGHDPDREPPFFFMKSPGNLETSGRLPYPRLTEELHFEVELVAALSGGGSDIPASEALSRVYGYAVGLDMTRRDLQAVAKKLGRPWDTAKAFEHSAPCSPLRCAAEIGHPAAGRISLSVDGELRQQGDLSQMIWSVPEQIAELSRYFELRPGDLVFTGTPAGVGPVQRGQRILGSIDGVGTLLVEVV